MPSCISGRHASAHRLTLLVYSSTRIRQPDIGRPQLISCEVISCSTSTPPIRHGSRLLVARRLPCPVSSTASSLAVPSVVRSFQRRPPPAATAAPASALPCLPCLPPLPVLSSICPSYLAHILHPFLSSRHSHTCSTCVPLVHGMTWPFLCLLSFDKAAVYKHHDADHIIPPPSQPRRFHYTYMTSGCSNVMPRFNIPDARVLYHKSHPLFTHSPLSVSALHLFGIYSPSVWLSFPLRPRATVVQFWRCIPRLHRP